MSQRMPDYEALRERQARAQESIVTACSCIITDESYWFRYGSAVEPGSQWEPNPECPAHFPERPAA